MQMNIIQIINPKFGIGLAYFCVGIFYTPIPIDPVKRQLKPTQIAYPYR